MSRLPTWVIDGNNVMGSRPDGWWHDRVKAAARLTQEIAVWCRSHEDPVVLVFDGQPQPAVTQLAGGNLTVLFAPGRRNAADDRIVGLLGGGQGGPGRQRAQPVIVVTADKGLVARLPEGTDVIGPRRFLELIGIG